jgi:hypothetical protein
MSEHDSNKQLDESTIIQHSQEWLNEHGQPSYSYLKKLAENENLDAREELVELAERYNVPYDKSTTLKDLVEKIRLFMGLGQDSV